MSVKRVAQERWNVASHHKLSSQISQYANLCFLRDESFDLVFATFLKTVASSRTIFFFTAFVFCRAFSSDCCSFSSFSFLVFVYDSACDARVPGHASLPDLSD